MPSIPDGIGGLARTRRGLVVRPLFLAEGITDDDIRGEVRRGVATRLQAGVALVSAVEPTWEDRLAAAVAATPGAVASHTSAARLHGLDGVVTSAIEVTIPYSSGGEPRGAVVHRTRNARPGTVVRGIPVVGVEQTLLDLAARRGMPQVVLLKALASALRKRLTTIVALRVFLVEVRGKGVQGVRRLESAIARYDDGSPPPGSDGEVAFFEFLTINGIELPTRQHELVLPDGSSVFLDFAWEERTKSIEFDGLASRADSRAHDRELLRQNAIWDLGWELRRFSAIALRERPRETHAQILRFLL